MGRLVLYGVGGVVAIAAALKLLALVLGTIIGIFGFIVFRLVPLLLLGWLLVWLWRQWKKAPA